MKKIIIVILVMLSSLMAEIIKNGIQKTYYKNGSIHTEISYKNGKLHGSLKKYYSNGVLQHLDIYLNGEASGTSKTYYDNGVLQYETKFKKGSSDEYEVYKTYYKTSVLKKIRNKEMDITYYPNGQIAIDKNGTYPSDTEAFIKVYRVLHFHMREPIEKEDRKKLIGTHYKNIENNYDLRYYGENGDLKYIVPYRNNKKEGLAIKLYYKRGYYLKTTMYKNNKKEGYETIYKKKGKLHDRKIQALLNDDSNCSMYDESDVLVSKVLYKQGRKVDE